MDKVPVVMSAMSGVSMALVPLAAEKHVVLFANVGHPNVTGQNPWVFRNFPTAEQEAQVMVRFAVQTLDARRAAILYPRDDWGLSGRDAFRREFAADGRQLVADESYEKTDAAYRTQLSKIKAAEPEVLYFTGFGNALGLIARQARELGLECHLLTTTGFNDKAIIGLAQEAAEGIYLTTSAFDPESEDPKVRAFVAAFEARFARKPAFDEALQYDTVEMIANVMRRGVPNATRIRHQLSSIQAFPGVAGETSVDSSGNFRTSIVVGTIKEGSVVRVAQSED